MARNGLRLGVRLPGDDYARTLEAAQRAEALGYDFLVFNDQASNPALEGWTLATAVAARTERIRITHATLNLPWRYPPFVVKMAASLDQVSNGRLDLCIGAGGVLPFLLEDYAAYGVTVGSPGQRYADVRDFIQMARGMWAHERFTYQGQRFGVTNAVCLPKPVNGTIPIWVGAQRPRMLRLIGQMADGWMKNRGWPESMEEYRAMNAAIDEAAVTAGRDPAAIRRVVNVVVRVGEGAGGGEGRPVNVAGAPQQVAAQLRQALDAGADTLSITFADDRSVEGFAREVMPLLRG